MNTTRPARIAYVTTFPPRECGIATFTQDLINATNDLFAGSLETVVIAMNTPNGQERIYPPKVISQIEENTEADYIAAAEKVNADKTIKLISIQHEYGIFGTGHGKNILLFLEHVKKPVSVTLHTVLPAPSAEMKEVTQKIIEKADHVVVMTRTAKEILLGLYTDALKKIRIIPHGIHPEPFETSDLAKEHIGQSGKRTLTTFGLLGRGKGIEQGIHAMVEIIKKYPDAVYLILGATHPVVVRNEGEAYRSELMELCTQLGVEKNIHFHNAYLEKEELLTFLKATDIYLSLSQNPDQAVSGTLTYALGSGRPVISTSFMQARELITEDVGKLVGFNKHDDISHAAIDLFSAPELLASMSRTAYFRTRNMTWPNVALAYMSTFEELSLSLLPKSRAVPAFTIKHLKKLSDDFGIFQFADLSSPNPKWGYTLDDNARALVTLSWHAKSLPSEKMKGIEALASIYLNFIAHCAKQSGGFINYFTKDREAHDELNKNENLEDAGARALWSLAVASNSPFSHEFRERAEHIFKEQLRTLTAVSSPRAAAWRIKALAEFRGQHTYIAQTTDLITSYAEFLLDLYTRSSDENWKWFEESLTYSNAVLAEAMLIAHTCTGNEEYATIGMNALDFLLAHSFEGTLCTPIGQEGWYKKGGTKQIYDQQPEEVSAIVLALHTVLGISPREEYEQKMVLAFNWFLGNNSSNQVIYTHSTGGCYDGIGREQVNLNQGAESTLSYLLARLALDSH